MAANHTVYITHATNVNNECTAMDLRTIAIESAKHLGYEDLKDKQIEAVTTYLDGHDTFVSLPTGYGKSLIYSLLPLAFDKYKG